MAARLKWRWQWGRCFAIQSRIYGNVHKSPSPGVYEHHKSCGFPQLRTHQLSQLLKRLSPPNGNGNGSAASPSRRRFMKVFASPPATVFINTTNPMGFPSCASVNCNNGCALEMAMAMAALLRVPVASLRGCSQVPQSQCL